MQAQNDEFTKTFNLYGNSDREDGLLTEGDWEFTINVGINDNIILKNNRTNSALTYHKVGKWNDYTGNTDGESYKFCVFKCLNDNIKLVYSDDYIMLLNLKKDTHEFYRREDIAKPLVFNENYKEIDKYSLDVGSNGLTTNIMVKKGDWIKVNASGYIKVGQWVGNSGPEGINGYGIYNHYADFKHGALLIQVENSPVWRGTNREFKFMAENNGILKFMVNDNDPGNNSGVYSVNLVHYKY